jgi:hypothetical protein
MTPTNTNQITVTLTIEEAGAVARAIERGMIDPRTEPGDRQVLDQVSDRLWEEILDRRIEADRRPGDVLDDAVGDVYLSQARLG